MRNVARAFSRLHGSRGFTTSSELGTDACGLDERLLEPRIVIDGDLRTATTELG